MTTDEESRQQDRARPRFDWVVIAVSAVLGAGGGTGASTAIFGGGDLGRVADRVTRLEKDVEEIEEKQIPRGEYDQRITFNELAHSQLRGADDAIVAELRDLKSRVRDLERRGNPQ